MALLCQAGAEPIPGYQLVEQLGTGGYGEVWKATAPGGLTKAIKIVYGHMRDARAEQELKALGRIKEVRHPFILSLERFEIIDNQLVIVMELADRSLMDRFEECVRSGLPGIPRNELLAHLLDAADALDYMGEQYGLQHLDIKPQNLLLVGGRIKLADFGLVKDLQGTMVSATGGITAIYATPEAFDGKVSRYSDQYSLAIVYQEMLTGSRPFPGTTPLQLAAQHSKCPPILDSLSLRDRRTIARALSKVPDQRFPTCRELVQNLLEAGLALPAAVSCEAGTPLHVRAELPRPVVPKAADPATDAESDSNGPTVLRAQPSPVPVQKPPAETVRVEQTGWRLTSEAAGGRQLRPTLFVGVGGIAGWTLRRLRQRLHRRQGDLAAVPSVRLLLLDTDRAGLKLAEQGEEGVGLQTTETLLLPLRRPEHYRPQSQTLLRWLDRRWLYNIPRSLLTEGARPLGLLALVDNAAELLSRLREAVAALVHGPGQAATVGANGAGLRDKTLQVFLVASMAGGTGGGMVVGLAYAVQQVLAEFHLPGDNLCGILVHATSQRRTEQELARLNAYATLIELQQFSSRTAVYPGDSDHGLIAFGPERSPFRDTYIVHLGDQLDRASAEAATDSLAEYLYLGAAMEVGAFLDQWRQKTHAAAYGQDDHSRLRLFGLHRFSFPRFPVAALAADLFCKHVVDRWYGQAGGWEEKRTEKESLAQIPMLGLDAETLAEQLHAAALSVFGEEPEQSFLKILADFPLDPTAEPAQTSPAGLAREALAKIDIFLGPGPDLQGRKARTATPVDVELSNQARALSMQLGRALIDWLLTLVEDPERRLIAAYHAGRWSLHHIAASCKSLRGRLAKLRRERALTRRRLAAGDFGTRSSAIAWLGRPRGEKSGSYPKQKLVAYCWLRLQESVLENIFEVFDAVAGQISNFMQDLERGRKAIRHFGALLVPISSGPRAASEPPLSLPNLTELLPGQCQCLEEAARSIFQRLGPKFSEPLEKAIQAEVLDPQGGLWGLACGTGELVQRLQNELQRRVLSALLDATRDLDAAMLFLESRRDLDHALRDLLAYIVSVSPNQEVPKGWQHLVLALPASPAGTTLRQLLGPALAEVPYTVVDSEGDIVLCYEVAHLPLRQVAEILIGDAASFAETARHVLTRNDIAWSPLSLDKTASKG